MEAQQVLNAIRGDEVDALVVRKGASETVFALTNINDLRQADETLQELEKRFETLASHAPIGIFMNDAAGKCIYVNQRACEIVGLSATEVFDHGILETIHPDDRERVMTGFFYAGIGEVKA